MRDHADTHFYHPFQDPQGLVTLDADESAHACRVLRLKPGASLEVCNGKGILAQGELITADPHASQVRLHSVLEQQPMPPRVSLVAALLRGDDLEESAEHCLQAPLAELILLRSEHCQVPNGATHDRLLRRLNAKSLVALKQSRKLWLTQIIGPCPLQEWLPKAAQEKQLVLLDAAGQSDHGALHQCQRPLLLCVGPEGGFSPRECQAFEQHNAIAISLGKSRLRAKTAGVFALGALCHLL